MWGLIDLEIVDAIQKNIPKKQLFDSHSVIFLVKGTTAYQDLVNRYQARPQAPHQIANSQIARRIRTLSEANGWTRHEKPSGQPWKAASLNINAKISSNAMWSR
jgi:hypothetical protein